MEVKIVGGQAERRNRAAFIPDKLVEDGEYGLSGNAAKRSIMNSGRSGSSFFRDPGRTRTAGSMDAMVSASTSA